MSELLTPVEQRNRTLTLFNHSLRTHFVVTLQELRLSYCYVCQTHLVTLSRSSALPSSYLLYKQG